MKPIYNAYLAILKSFVEDRKPQLAAEDKPEALMQLASIHSTPGIVAYTYMHWPELTDENTADAMRSQCLDYFALYIRRAERMKNLMEKLDEAGIDHLMMKGFVVKDYYTVPEMRAYGDIDFVIRPEDRQKCHELMKSLGYEVKADYEPVYSYRRGEEYYEVHTDIMTVNVSDKADYMSYFRRIWENAVPIPDMEHTHSFVFRPEYHFLYLLTHIAKHISGSGAGIRMYLDIAFFVKHFGESLDWAWVAGELEKLGLAEFANVALTAAEEWFEVESPIPLRPIPDEVKEDFLDFTMEAGIFGYNGRDKSIVFLKQQDRNGEKVSKFKTLVWHAFPPADDLEYRYAYLQKSHLLLPVAWVHRLVGSYKEWGRYADHTKKILSADEEEVRKLRRIYQEIGL